MVCVGYLGDCVDIYCVGDGNWFVVSGLLFVYVFVFVCCLDL